MEGGSQTPATGHPDQLSPLLETQHPPVLVAAAGPGWVGAPLPPGRAASNLRNDARSSSRRTVPTVPKSRGEDQAGNRLLRLHSAMQDRGTSDAAQEACRRDRKIGLQASGGYIARSIRLLACDARLLEPLCRQGGQSAVAGLYGVQMVSTCLVLGDYCLGIRRSQVHPWAPAE